MDSAYGLWNDYTVPTSKFEVTANATNEIVEGYAFPEITDWFFYYIRVFVANLFIMYVTVKIAAKCVQLKLLRSAHHAFYSIIAGMMCTSESLLFYYNIVLHPFFGMLAIGLGWMGIGIQIINHWNQHDLRHISKHAIFGFTGSFLLFIIAVSGIVLLMCPLSQRVFKFFMSSHRFVGLLTYVMMMTAVAFSYNTGFARRHWTQSHIDWLKRSTFILTAATCSHEMSRLVIYIVNNMPKVFYNTLHISTHEHHD